MGVLPGRSSLFSFVGGSSGSIRLHCSSVRSISFEHVHPPLADQLPSEPSHACSPNSEIASSFPACNGRSEADAAYCLRASHSFRLERGWREWRPSLL